MKKLDSFMEQVNSNVAKSSKSVHFLELTQAWICEAIKYNYAYNFTWLGRPLIQIPQDAYTIQELIWTIRPNLIIETGIAHGGSLILSASMLAMLDYCDAVENGLALDPSKSKRKVVGIDIDIRTHNRTAIEAHPLSNLITLIEGSSIDEGVINKIKKLATNCEPILIFLDSNHTHDHVFAELEAYAPIVTVGSYCVVWDTGIENLPEGYVTNRPWGKGNNPKTAVFEYLKKIATAPCVGLDGNILKFEIDKFIEHKVAITAAPDGYLKRVA